MQIEKNTNVADCKKQSTIALQIKRGRRYIASSPRHKQTDNHLVLFASCMLLVWCHQAPTFLEIKERQWKLQLLDTIRQHQIVL
jgi:hypothetical protein